MTLALALLGLSLVVHPVAAADVSGVWEMLLTSDATSIPRLACTLAQNGQELTGSCKPAGGPQSESVDLTGKVDGDRISCQWNVVTPNGQKWTYALTGKLDAKSTTMDGTFTLSGGFKGEGTFKGTKQ
jgi:hypothetical protein